jgi:hypothetical protein
MVLPMIVESDNDEIAIVVANSVEPVRLDTSARFVTILDPMTLDTVMVLPTILDTLNDEICNVLTTMVEASIAFVPIVFVMIVEAAMELYNAVLAYNVDTILPICRVVTWNEEMAIRSERILDADNEEVAIELPDIDDNCRLDTPIEFASNVERTNDEILPVTVTIEEPVKEETLTELIIEVEPIMDCTPNELVVILDADNVDN